MKHNILLEVRTRIVCSNCDHSVWTLDLFDKIKGINSYAGEQVCPHCHTKIKYFIAIKNNEIPERLIGD